MRRQRECRTASIVVSIAFMRGLLGADQASWLKESDGAKVTSPHQGCRRGDPPRMLADEVVSQFPSRRSDIVAGAKFGRVTTTLVRVKGSKLP